MIVPNKLGCPVVSLEVELSLEGGDFGDNRNPKLLVKRENVDFAEFPLDESSWDPENGWGIFKLLAHDDMPVEDCVDCAESSCPETTAAESCP